MWSIPFPCPSDPSSQSQAKPSRSGQTVHGSISPVQRVLKSRFEEALLEDEIVMETAPIGPSFVSPSSAAASTTSENKAVDGVKDDDRTVKKRTKTGCQTCRTRRIKCDEGKPECRNCIKSKRQCGGYGVRVGKEMGSNMKRSRRFMPYGDKDGVGRTQYKNIVPAPPKHSEPKITPVVPIASTMPSSATIVATVVPVVESKAQSPKRKREDDFDAYEQPQPVYYEQTYSDHSFSPISQPSPRPPSPFRYALTSRISISSLLTVDQAAIAEFVAQQSLNTYTPNYYQNSPLTDPILFDAFRHYVDVVAPTMSLIESSPPNPTILNHHVIPSMKACNLFTYQLPIIAVSGNWAVMEAILAISFLHISHVTRSSKQQAFLHYQLALKRMRIESAKVNAARDLGLLAATLLLAWYELSTGDHLKWVRHMSGAMAVLIEFGSQRWRVTPEAAIMAGDCTVDCTLSYNDDPNYNTAYQPLENMRVVTDRLQISTGRILLHELFYLYGKMDVIQALVRGSLTVDWTYQSGGLADALLHLMARLAIFIATDRDRKTRLDQKMPPPSGAQQHHPTTRLSPQSNPSGGPSSSPDSSTPTPWSRSTSYSSQTDPTPSDAFLQWETLHGDFVSWKSALESLSTKRVEPNMPTPFGPAIIYSDLRVAAAQMLYLASLIHLNRAHPSTPHFSPAAIGATAPKNGPLVAELMRIQEGFWDTKNFKDVEIQEDGRKVGKEGRTKDFVVSSLSNSAWPMLVGGVQVKDDGQRKWLKTRLCDIYELSGFATAMRVRKGLEVAWGHRQRGEPTGFDDIDSDDEHDMSLQAADQRAQARELSQRREVKHEERDGRFILVKEGEAWMGMGSAKEQANLTLAYGVLGPE